MRFVRMATWTSGRAGVAVVACGTGETSSCLLGRDQGNPRWMASRRSTERRPLGLARRRCNRLTPGEQRSAARAAGRGAGRGAPPSARSGRPRRRRAATRVPGAGGGPAAGGAGTSPPWDTRRTWAGVEARPAEPEHRDRARAASARLRRARPPPRAPPSATACAARKGPLRVAPQVGEVRAAAELAAEVLGERAHVGAPRARPPRRRRGAAGSPAPRSTGCAPCAARARRGRRAARCGGAARPRASPSCTSGAPGGSRRRSRRARRARRPRPAAAPSWRLSTVPSASKVSVATPSSIEPA